MSFGTLALVVALGLIGPLLALLPGPLTLPAVVGEIAAGVAFGQTGTRTIVATQPTLSFLADIGFALLMLIVATNLPLRDTRLWGASRRGLLVAAVTFALAIAVSPLVAVVGGLHRPAILTVLIASSSAAIVLPILGSHERDQSLLVTVAWVTIADIATALAVPFVLSTGGFGRALTGAVLVVAGAALAGVVITYLSRQKRVEELRDASHHLAWALDLRVWLVVLFTLAWIAERYDTSVLIAGFACGIVISAVGQPRRVADQLIGLGEGFFVPLFFVVLGARIDLRALVHSREDLGLFAALAIATTLVPVVAAMITRLPYTSGLLAGAAFGVPSAIASIGLAAKVLEPGQAAAVVGAAVVSLAATSLGAIRLGLNPRINPRAPDAEA